MLRRLLAVLVAVPLFAVSASAQAATTVCKDGTTSAATGRGACTGHGGVDKKAAKSAAATAKAEQKVAQKSAQKSAQAATKKAAATAPAVPAPRPAAPTPSTTRAANTDPTGATAQCKDGTYSHAATRRGACSRHQGVARWL